MEVRTVMEVVIVSTTLEPVVCCASLAAAAMSDDEATATAELFRASATARVRIVNLVATSDEPVCA